jgi:hypothetical protein
LTIPLNTVATTYRLPARPVAAIQEDGALQADPLEIIRRLIWLYMILWLIEGGLRRWFLPGLATPLLLVRDPVVMAIYYQSIQKKIFPINGFFFSGLALGFLTFASALMIGHGNIWVALYGVRCDFFQVPLIFVMARVLCMKDLFQLARVALIISIPYTLLLVAQFYEPQSSWVNRGIGDSLEGAGFSGAEGRFRPPGTFSFINGPGLLYPLFTACWFTLLLARRISTGLLLVSALAILIAIPVSVSRGLFLAVLAVAIVGVIAMLSSGRLTLQTILQAGLAAIILPLLVSHIPAFNDGMVAFESRWTTATTESGGFQEAIVGRVLNDLFGSFDQVTLTGLGTGYSTNVGQKLLTQQIGFGASEAEWGRLLYDNGLFLGCLLVAYRVALSGILVVTAFTAWRQRSAFALIFCSTAFLNVINGQWGQSSALGAAVIASGLAMAAARNAIAAAPATRRIK